MLNSPLKPATGPERFLFASAGSSADGVLMMAQDPVLADVEASSLDDVEFLDPRKPGASSNPWFAAHFDTHPEWSNFPAIKYHDSNDQGVPAPSGIGFDNTLWEQAKSWCRFDVGQSLPVTELNFISPRLDSAGACRTYPPRLLKLRGESGMTQPDHWVALVPCSHVVARPEVAEESGAGPGGGSQTIKMFTEPIPAAFEPDQMWLDHYLPSPTRMVTGTTIGR